MPKVGADAAQAARATRTPKCARRPPRAWATSSSPRRSGALVKTLTDAEPRVQFFAAQSLGKLKDAKSTRAAARAAAQRNDNKDAYLRHAAAHALASIGKNAALDAGVQDTSAAVRLGVVLAYRELRDANVAWFLERLAMPTSCAKRPSAINDAPIEGAYARARRRSSTARRSTTSRRGARASTLNYRLGTAANAKALAQYATRDARQRGHARRSAAAARPVGQDAAARPHRRHLSSVAARATRKAAADALTPVLPKVLGKGPEAVQLAALEADRQPAAARSGARAGRDRRQREGARGRARRRAQGARRLRRR